MGTILKTKDLTKKYDNKVVVNNLNIEIEEGEADEELVEASKKRLSQMETLLGDDNTINSLVCDILEDHLDPEGRLVWP